MSKYTCKRCLNEFSQKSHYDKHVNKKKSCKDKKEKIKDVIETIVKKLISGNPESDEVTTMALNEQSASEDLLALFNKILETESYNYIATNLNISVGTAKRWNELHKVPPLYTFQLMKLAKINIDYSKFTYKQKDQFFTPSSTAKYCYSKFIQILEKYGDSEKEYTYIEPSAGNGSFLKILPSDRRIGLDIEPHNDEITKGDYLEWVPSEDKECVNGKYVVIGNPPFGLRGQLALKFINHSDKFADYVSFILPQLFESDGKGVPRKRVIGFNLVHSEKITTDFESPKGDPIKVQCIFQVWSKNHVNIDYKIVDTDISVVKIYSLSDGGAPSTTRNKKMFNKCHAYIPSTCFGKNNMKYYSCFDELPGRKGYGVVFNKNKTNNLEKFKSIDWSEVAFLSTNSAYNIRTSQITAQFV